MLAKTPNFEKADIILSMLSDRTKYSPDFKEITKLENILVFIYDEYQDKFLGKTVFKNDKYLGRGRTVYAGFRMMYRGGVPVIYQHGVHCNRSIIGDIYAVSPKTLFELDRVMENTQETTRFKTYIYAVEQQLNGVEFSPSIECFLYKSRVSSLAPDTVHFDIREVTQKMGTYNDVLTQEYLPIM